MWMNQGTFLFSRDDAKVIETNKTRAAVPVEIYFQWKQNLGWDGLKKNHPLV